jgi:hypothetical protein
MFPNPNGGDIAMSARTERILNAIGHLTGSEMAEFRDEFDIRFGDNPAPTAAKAANPGPESQPEPEPETDQQTADTSASHVSAAQKAAMAKTPRKSDD